MDDNRRHHKAVDALSIGVLDAIVPADALLPEAFKLLERAIDKEIPWRARRRKKQAPLTLNAQEAKLAMMTAQSLLAQKVTPDYPAPYAVVNVVEKALQAERDEAIEIEKSAFIQLAKTPAARALIQIFLNDQAVKSLAKRQIKRAEPLQRAAVLGAGIMGGGIAFQSAHKVCLRLIKDINSAALDMGIEEVHAAFLLLKKNKVTPAKMQKDIKHHSSDTVL